VICQKSSVFGRPFVKWFALCYCTIVCLCVCPVLSVMLVYCACPVLSVTLMYCGQAVGWLQMKLGMQALAKLRGICPLLGRGDGSPSNTMLLRLRPTSLLSGILIHPAIWPQQIWAKNWRAVPLRGRGPGSPSNTMWPGPRPTCMPSFILIHPTVWPQYTNVTDRTHR